ncbi:MAG: hypothetical protein S4CHLAM81_06060 [Chlamydiales bacterium]|nr:hypothetical protein [Chlamydiales bacterium]MCH9635390.1 hypothetical protein [Chlamydiales bacterium]MCH9704340.1 hypothetical protein [Chlamydiota bacterium]
MIRIANYCPALPKKPADCALVTVMVVSTVAATVFGTVAILGASKHIEMDSTMLDGSIIMTGAFLTIPIASLFCYFVCGDVDSDKE